MLNEIQSNSISIVFHLFTESIEKTGKRAHVHSHCEVLPFYALRAGMLWIGIAGFQSL